MNPDDIESRVAAEWQQQRENDLRQAMDTAQGRRLLFGIMSGTGTFSKTFTGSSQSYYNEGRRSVGLDLFHEVMDIEPSRFLTMWNEDKEARAERERRINAESED